MMDSKGNYRFHLKVKSSSMNESKCTQRLKARKPSRRPIDLQVMPKSQKSLAYLEVIETILVYQS